jgi:iron complex outermembrane receptor protein
MNLYRRHVVLLSATAIQLALSGSNPAFAQSVSPQSEWSGLEEIIVTAQRREQSLQDVPIAVTALTSEDLVANRVLSVADLTGLAPGLIVAESAGGGKIPFFIIRGATSAGLVPGSDKQVSLYLDGVYLSSTRGSIFDLPDLERIEVLRGPQGTLFGRNATAGAVSISTRDPTGEVGVKVLASIGNYDQYRFGVSVDLPQVGPLSGYVSALYNYRRGDIRNVAAGQIWDRRNALSQRNAKVTRSPEFLGTTDSTSVFGALKFESGDFSTVY